MSSNMQGRRSEDGTIGTARFVVQSSDVLSDMRVNVSEEGSERVVWYKERFLADDEIVEQLVENATSTILWTIHRPKRGWYIRLRTPLFPEDVFIPLLPLPQTSPYYLDTALTFACRNPPPYSFTISHVQSPEHKGSTDTAGDPADKAQDAAVHEYPPTPPPLAPSVIVHPPSPNGMQPKPNAVEFKPPPGRPASAKRPPHPPITHFMLSPQSQVTPQQADKLSLFTRMLSVIRSQTPAYSYSFALSPIPDPWALPSSSTARQHRDAAPATPVPLLTFYDRTPVWTANSLSGVIEVDMKLVRSLGVETSFYLAVALTYLDFLSERESYLAALND